MPIVSLIQDLYQGLHRGTAVAWPVDKNTCTARGTLSDTDALNPLKSCEFGVEVSFDGGQTYTNGGTLGWTGGVDPRTQGPNIPAVAVPYSASGVRPTHARVVIDSPAPLSIGGTVEFS